MHTVFVYGILKTPRHFASPPERVRGVMYVLDGYAACLFSADEDSWVHGELRQVDDATLAHWDWIEGVEAGWYRRVRVMTHSGVEAWAYELSQPAQGLDVVREGVWLESESESELEQTGT